MCPADCTRALIFYVLTIQIFTPAEQLHNFNQEVLNSDKPVLIDFWAPWCGPCRMVVPLVEEIAKERSDIKVVKINVDEEQELAMQFGVMSIPTLVVMKNGKIVNQVTGARPKAQILAML